MKCPMCYKEMIRDDIPNQFGDLTYKCRCESTLYLLENKGNIVYYCIPFLYKNIVFRLKSSQRNNSTIVSPLAGPLFKNITLETFIPYGEHQETVYRYLDLQAFI